MQYKIMETRIKDKPTILLKKDGKEIFLHSKYNPEREGKAFAEKYYKGSKNYIIYGLGLGYHIEELVKKLEEENKSYKIYVIESNEEIYKYFLNINKKILNNKNIKIIKVFDSDDIKYLDDIKELNDFINCIHKPSMELIDDKFESLKDYMEEVLVLENLPKKTLELLEDNFKSNIKEYDEYVNRLFNKYIDKPMFLVSAGPSLDKNIKELKRAKNKGLIVSVGRAVRALVKEDIIPDYIVVTDPSKNLYKNQLKGLNLEVPIIILSTADKNFMKKYNGEKYIGFQKEYDLSEKYANGKNLELLATGGSVATTSLDIGIKMGCNPIIFVGQDLAYTNNKSHSKNSKGTNIENKEIYFEVEDINGNKVITRKNLNMYRKWIERRIKRESQINFYDCTEGGAKIKGTKIIKLKDIVDKITRD